MTPRIMHITRQKQQILKQLLRKKLLQEVINKPEEEFQSKEHDVY